MPVVVDFWAPWCQPCKMIEPILDELAKDYAGKIVVGKLNTDENQQPRFDRPAQSFNRDDRGNRPGFVRRDRPGFNRNDRPGFDRSASSERSAHPLSQQLRRESEEKSRGPRKFGPKKRFSR